MTDFGPALLVFGRCLGFAMRAPGLNHPNISHMPRLITALGLTVGIVPLLHPAVHQTMPLLLAFACECAIGAAIGQLCAAVCDAAYAGGKSLEEYIGVRGSVPSATVAGGAELGRLWSNAFLAVLMIGGGFERMLVLFARTFERLPPGVAPPSAALVQYAERLISLVMQTALVLIGPALVLACCTHIAIGLLARIVPRLQTFQISFPVVFGVVVSFTAAAVPTLLPLAAGSGTVNIF